MKTKILFLLLLFVNISFASYEKVRIGKIDPFYENRITKEQLLEIVLDIKNRFDSQLGFSVFEYHADGKKIDIVYIPPSKLKKDISKLKKTVKEKKENILRLRGSSVSMQPRLKIKQEILNNKNRALNKEIKKLNSYIQKKNKQKNFSKEEYKKIKAYIKKENKKLNIKRTSFKHEQIKFKSFLSSYNQKVTSYNQAIKVSNRLNEKLRKLTKDRKEVKGVAIGYKEVKLKTYYKNGKKVKEKTVKNYMKKIEIYGFENFKQLKAVLAHELGHLVGVQHIDIKGAVMNPILQKRQLKNLLLLPEDIKAFQKVFN